jgi:hypothetical protein
MFNKVQYFFKGMKMGTKNISSIVSNEKNKVVVLTEEGKEMCFLKKNRHWLMSDHINHNSLLYGTTIVE